MHTPTVEYMTPDAKPPYTAVKSAGGSEAIQILGVDGFSILATVHKRKGYEAIAAQFAAAPELLEYARLEEEYSHACNRRRADWSEMDVAAFCLRNGIRADEPVGKVLAEKRRAAIQKAGA